MVNENTKEFMKNQREVRGTYLAGAKDNRTEATNDTKYNNRTGSTKSVER